MKFLLCSLILSLGSISSMYAANAPKVGLQESQDEITRVDQLIDATEISLTRIKNLKILLIEYKKIEALAIKNPNDTDNLLKLVNLASQIQDKIHDAALQDYFSPQFLEELKKFSSIADKKNIPQAK